MVRFQHVIQDDLGIHARPAGLLSREAKNFHSAITIKKQDKSADVNRVFALMQLGAKKGDTIEVEITGPDEQAALLAFQTLLNSQL